MMEKPSPLRIGTEIYESEVNPDGTASPTESEILEIVEV